MLAPISTLTRCRSGEIRLAEDRMPDEAALLGSDLILATVGVMGIVLGEEFSCAGRLIYESLIGEHFIWSKVKLVILNSDIIDIEDLPFQICQKLPVIKQMNFS